MALAESGKVRLDWIDYSKGIAIILVVYRHILIGVQTSGLEVEDWLINANEIVYSFRMPLFFVISGLFVVKSMVKRPGFIFLKYKFNTILYPYLIWGLIQLTIQVVLSNYINANRGWMDYLYLLIQPRAIDHLWYLYALFNVSILFHFLYHYLKLSSVVLSVVSVVLFGLSTYVAEYSLIHDTCYFFVFFLIGYLTRDILINDKYAKIFQSKKPFFVLLPFFVLTQVYWLFNKDVNIFIFAGIAVLGTAFIFSLSFILSKYKIANFLTIVGRHSLYIYLTHVMIVAAVRVILVNFLGFSNPIVILLIGWAIGTVLPIVFYRLIKNTVLTYLFSLEKK